jgi:DNA-binding HxlR family transcriptional regulator
MGRSYSQYCPVAHALDVVGERWSLLVVRELQEGPLRYSDLLGRLDGCATNVLASRLRELEQAGVVTRETLPPPAGSTVYTLTPSGEALRPVLTALALWGARTIGPPPDDSVLRPGWLVRALQTALAPVAPPDLHVGIRAGTDAATLHGSTVHDGIDDDCDAVLTGDGRAVYHLLVDGDASALDVDGDPDTVEQIREAVAAAWGGVPASL